MTIFITESSDFVLLLLLILRTFWEKVDPLLILKGGYFIDWGGI
jgi:hypothetical protein